MSICAPLVEPCCASYIEVLTRNSSIESGAGVGRACPTARYGDAELWIGAAEVLERLAEPPRPVLLTTRAEATELVLLPLKRLLASTPLSWKVLLVSRCPLAQMGLLPRPLLTPVLPASSELTPGERTARPVKLPVGRGMDSIWSFSRM